MIDLTKEETEFLLMIISKLTVNPSDQDALKICQIVAALKDKLLLKAV